MRKAHFTRKNFIFMSLLFMYLILSVFAAMACDANNPLFKKGNPIQVLGNGMGFPLLNGSFAAYALLLLFAIYIFLVAGALIFEYRMAKYYNQKPWTKKRWAIYVGTVLVGLTLCIGIGLAAQYPYDPEFIGHSFLFSLQAFVIGLIFALVIGGLAAAICGVVINIKHIDEPFKLFGKKSENDADKEEEEEKAELVKLREQGNLANAFGEPTRAQKDIADAIANAGVGGAGVVGTVDGEAGLKLGEKERVFPGLCTIDLININATVDDFEDNYTLSEITDKFRKYLAKQEKLYFEEATIKAFISALAASRFIILEGMSGTGKSSIARYFSEFISEKSFFEPVQATWRDRTSVLGYYNDFSKSYNETEFLKRLYDSNYRNNHVNIMVLDEFNISRVEYYFADFLSVMEYPMSEWKLKIMQLPYDFDAPEKLEDGVLQIPENTWFIGTANKDDSTYTITDKVYDRAITLSFDGRNTPFEVAEEAGRIKVSYAYLQQLFEDAINEPSNQLTDADMKKFAILTDYAYDTFDLSFGNRILNQIYKFVPVYVACGGNKEDGLDFLFARKVIYKLQGRFEDYIKQGLIDLQSLIVKTYGKDSFKETNKEINKLLRKL